MNLSLLAQKDALKPYAMTREHRRMHTLLIMASLNVLTNPTELEKLRTNVEMIVKVGLNSIILIARADESIPGVRENPLTNYDITKEQIAKELKVPSNRVFACVPYRNESTRGFEIERSAFFTSHGFHSHLASQACFQDFDSGHRPCLQHQDCSRES